MTTKDFSAWQYNVISSFKNKTVEEIRLHLKETVNPFAVAMENWESDFNFSSLVRNANAFNAKEIFYLGKKRWDRRGAQGTYHYKDVNYIQSFDDFIKLKEKYKFVSFDNVEGSCEVGSFVWPDNSLIIFGSENLGISKEILAISDHIVSIKQYGSVRSLNASVASGIAMYDYVNKRK